MLQIYNTLTKRKEPFQPLHPPKVGIYVCGLTAYDHCHIGHARSIFVCFDIIVRYLRVLGYDVTYVRNITDIDDKIIKRSQDLKEGFTLLTKRIIDSMHADEKALGVLSPTIEPRVTEHIPLIIDMIQTLIDKGYAYVSANGDVYYNVNKFKPYGELAHQDLTSLKSGARVEVTDNKHDPLDFVLWKSAKPNEPFWPSPWGNGRPGWHIECSAMAKKYLGTYFDIHGGGADLQFPHHQNEIAQSEAANNSKFVNFWMHVGFVQVDKEKMSKSLGNFFTIKEVLAKYHPEVLRYFMLSSHYRSPLNYTVDNLNNAQNALQRLYLTLRGLESPTDAEQTRFILVANKFPGVEQINALAASLNADESTQFICAATNFMHKFYAAMDDDFNTPEAIAVLFDIAHEINRCRDNKQIAQATQLGKFLRQLSWILGILQLDAEQFLRAGCSQSSTDLNAEAADKNKFDDKQIDALVAARTEARKNKNWVESDRIRKELSAMGIILEDTAQGTAWRKS